MTTPTTALQRVDPLTAYPRPPFPRREAPSGRFEDLEPAADHGEESYVGRGRLAGLKTLITGGDSGIGRAVAIAFAREGADVAVAYLAQDGDADDTLRLVEEAGCRGMLLEGDLASEDQCRNVVEAVRSEFGRIDVLVNNAATQRRREEIDEVSTPEWERILRVNLTSPFWLCREAVRAVVVNSGGRGRCPRGGAMPVAPGGGGGPEGRSQPAVGCAPGA